MKRFLEIAALSAGGLFACLVGYAACAKVTGHGEDDVRAFGRWLARADPSRTLTLAPSTAPSTGPATNPSASVAVPIEASFLSAWKLPAPYSGEELELLAAELVEGRAELVEHRRLLAQRAQELEASERRAAERLAELEELGTRLEALREELTRRELELGEHERLTRGGSLAGLASVLEELEEPSAAARLLQALEPHEAAQILAAFSDPDQAKAVLNRVPPERWHDYASAYAALRTALNPGRRAP
jgi:flagellar motility protein MotE (MotC chaperone)